MNFNEDRYKYCRDVRGDSTHQLRKYLGTDLNSRSIATNVEKLTSNCNGIIWKIAEIWKYKFSSEIGMSRSPVHNDYYFQLCFEI